MKKNCKKNIGSLILTCGGILLFNCLDHILNDLLYAILLGTSILLCLCAIFISICYPPNEKKIARFLLIIAGLIGISVINVLLIEKILNAIMLSLTIIIFSSGIIILLNMFNDGRNGRDNQ